MAIVLSTWKKKSFELKLHGNPHADQYEAKERHGQSRPEADPTSLAADERDGK